MAKKLKKPAPKIVQLSGKGTKTVGIIMLDLSMWVFDADQDVLDFHAEQISRAFMLNYGIQNFGVKAFGFEEE